MLNVFPFLLLGQLRGRTSMAERTYPTSEVRGGGWEELPPPQARGGGKEKLPHIQGAVVAWAQEGLGELFHVQGQEGWQ